MSFELPTDANSWVAAGTVVLAVTTGVLALITGLYMRETRLIRKETEKMRIEAKLPSFAIEPSQFLWLIGESAPREFLKLNLVNHGETATDITAECQWLESPEIGGSSRTFYVLSLAKNGYAGLDVPVKDILQKNLLLRVRIKCKDARGKNYETEITNGFDKIKGTSIKIAYQNNYWLTLYGAIDNIYQELRRKK